MRTPSDLVESRRAKSKREFDAFSSSAFVPPSRANSQIEEGGFPRDLGESSMSGLGGSLILVGNPHIPRLRREDEVREGRPWPRVPETGRNYDVAHIKALADGGENTVDNIRPMHPAEHRAEHMRNGDYGRWGKRAAIARAFGGRVARLLGPFAIIPTVTGILSGRIRTDSIDNFSSDMMGVPSEEDRARAAKAGLIASISKPKPGYPTLT